MLKPLLIDTDILVDFLRGYGKAVEFINANVDRIILSSIVVAELYAGVRDDERIALDNFIALFKVIPISPEIAKVGGLYKRAFGRSHGTGLADAIFAATADAENAELMTLNVKHYPMIKGLRPPYRK